MAVDKKSESLDTGKKTPLGLILSPSSVDNPIVYSDDTWDIVDRNSRLASFLGGTGKYSQHDINEALSKAGSVGGGASQYIVIYDGDTVKDGDNNTLYDITATSDRIIITAVLHGCGEYPVVTCYQSGEVVDFSISKNASGDITVRWNNNIGQSVSVNKPLTICILGKGESAESSEYILKSETPGLVKNDGSIDETEYAPASSIPTNVSNLVNDSGFATTTEVNQLIGAISTMNMTIVAELPVSDISKTTIYLVPKSPQGSAPDIYDEYVYTANNTWEKIGNTQLDVTSYSHQYVYICKNYSSGHTCTILASTHGCGTTPVITCYLGTKVIELDITKNASGDLTIDWGSATVSPQSPLTISIMGATVTPVEEQQPVVINTITWYDDEGNTLYSETLNENDNITVPATPTKSGYTFYQWYCTETSDHRVPLVMPAYSLTVTAQFIEDTPVPGETYTVYWYDGNGSDWYSEDLEEGDTISYPATPSKQGYTFIGWYCSETHGQVPATMPAYNLHITAEFNENEYQAEFIYMDSTGSWVHNTQMYQVGDYVTEPIPEWQIEMPGLGTYTATYWDPSVEQPMPAYNISYTMQYDFEPWQEEIFPDEMMEP